MTKREREQATKRILAMVEASGIETTHRVTDDGIEFGFTSLEQADALRLNVMAMEGDFGAHVHTEHFDNAEERDAARIMVTEIAAALNIPFEGQIFDDRLELEFQSSADAIILRKAMDIAVVDGSDVGIAHGRGMQRRMNGLEFELNGPPQP
ncbi:MAG: hypothetical protein AAF636_08490 [Pseudomonadota bacterium]